MSADPLERVGRLARVAPDLWVVAGLVLLTEVVVVFGVALAPSLGPWPVAPATLTGGTSLVTLVALSVAVSRRASLSPTNRYSPLARLPSSNPRGESGLWDRLDGMTVALVVVLVLASTVAGYTILAPGAAESVTEFSLLTEDSSGALVLADGQRAFGSEGK